MRSFYAKLTLALLFLLTIVGCTKQPESQTKEMEKLQTFTAPKVEQSNQTSKKYKLTISNNQNINIEFLDSNNTYTPNLYLDESTYKIKLSKEFFTSKVLDVNLNKDLTLVVNLTSIFYTFEFNDIYREIEDGKYDINYEDSSGNNIAQFLIKLYIKKHTTNTEVNADAPDFDKFLKLIQYLIHKGIDINNLDNDGKNIITSILDQTPNKLFKVLINNGAKIQEQFINDNLNSSIFTNKIDGTLDKTKVDMIVPFLSAQKLTNMLNESWNLENIYFVKKLLERGANPQIALEKAKTLYQENSYVSDEFKKVYSYLNWTSQNYDKIKAWKDKQQIQLKVQQLKIELNQHILKGDLKELKSFIDRNEGVSALLSNKLLKLLFTGPSELSIGKIRKLTIRTKNYKEIIRMINSVETPYRLLTHDEILLLLKNDLNNEIINAITNKTRELLKDEELKTKYTEFKKEENRISKQNVSIEFKLKDNDRLNEVISRGIIDEEFSLLLDNLFTN